jgi:hypothetical protein
MGPDQDLNKCCVLILGKNEARFSLDLKVYCCYVVALEVDVLVRWKRGWTQQWTDPSDER